MAIPEEQKRELVRLFGSVGDNALWCSPGRHENILTGTIRQMYEGIIPQPFMGMVDWCAMNTDRLPADYALLTDKLRQLLSQYIAPDSDLIGDGFDDLVGRVVPSTFEVIVGELVKGAALLGPERAVTFLSDCLEEKPFYFTYHGIIKDAMILGLPEPEKDMQITTLPTNSANLPSPLRRLRTFHYESAWVGGCVLSMRCGFVPYFFLPSATDARGRPRGRELFFPDFPGQSPGTLLERIRMALSLATNGCALLTPQWCDYGDLRAFRSINSGPGIIVGPNSTVEITDTTLRDMREIMDMLPTNLNGDNKAVRAARNLISSFGLSSMLHDVASLRTAIDILFTPCGKDAHKHIKRGTADYLATDEEERGRIRETLCKTYTFASEVLHGKEIEDPESMLPMFQCAQGYVKRAILKQLQKGKAGSD